MNAIGPLRVSRPLLQRVIATVVQCSADLHECVVYVTAPIEYGQQASDLIHPNHSATTVSTEVTGRELDQVWDALLQRRERIVLQVHSHPGAAYHSSIDDGWPVVHRIGFLSLVLPHFGRSGMTGAHLVEYEGEGRWSNLPPKTWDGRLRIVDG